MDFTQLISQRYSVRSYQSKAIPEDQLLIILNAARMAPTAANRQPFCLIVIHTAGREEELLSIYPRDWFVQAPILLCLCGLSSAAWVRRDSRSYLDVDIGIVMDHLVLAATELGLGTCFIAAFDIQNARLVLNLPDEVEPILFTPLGYANELFEGKTRKDLAEFVRYEKW